MARFQTRLLSAKEDRTLAAYVSEFPCKGCGTRPAGGYSMWIPPSLRLVDSDDGETSSFVDAETGGPPPPDARVAHYPLCRSCFEHDEETKVMDRIEKEIEEEESAIAARSAAAANAAREQRELRRQERLSRHRATVVTESPAAATCSVEGCSRQRHFFDADGVGYCKRHADTAGVRPRGKIT